MIEEKFIRLMEGHFEGTLTQEEEQELISLLKENPEYKMELEEQKKIKEVLSKMNLKNPAKEAWDGYWMGIYNRLERGIAWFIITIGALIILGFASVKIVESFISDTQTPVLLKYGIAAVFFGFVILIFSLLREKIFSSSNDKYKEIQR